MSSIAHVLYTCYMSISVSRWHSHDTLLTHQATPASLERDPKALCEEPEGTAQSSEDLKTVQNQ